LARDLEGKVDVNGLLEAACSGPSLAVIAGGRPPWESDGSVSKRAIRQYNLKV
jgi:hypothetical protein